MNEFASQPLWLVSLCFIGVAVLLALVTFFSFRKFFPNGVFTGDGIRPATLVGTVIGSLFALLLALILVTVWQNYVRQEERTTMEAVVLANLYRDSKGLQLQECNQVQQLTVNYTRNLIMNGWEAMEGGVESEETFRSFNRLYGCIIQYQPANEKEVVLYKKLVDHLNELANYRRLRLISANQNNVPTTLWVIILVVGIISVCFTNLFNLGNGKAHAAIVSVHAIIISLILMLVFLLNQPYRGSTKIKPQPFRHLIERVYPQADSV